MKRILIIVGVIAAVLGVLGTIRTRKKEPYTIDSAIRDREEAKQKLTRQAQQMFDNGLNNAQIAERLDMPEAHVRGLLRPATRS